MPSGAANLDNKQAKRINVFSSMNLRQLTYFRAVVEHRSLAAAADVLNVAQPNLSVAIKQLEELWGVTLFERAGRGLVVTDTGRALYERAAELLGGASALDQEMRAIGRGFTSRLRVGFTQMSIDAIATMVTDMREDGNAVSFSLQQGEPQLLETMVETRQLDFAVTHMPVANPALAVEALVPLTMALLCREDDDRWQADKEITLDMLANVPLIVLRRRSGMGIYERIVEAFSVAGIALSVVATAMTLPQSIPWSSATLASAYYPCTPRMRRDRDFQFIRSRWLRCRGVLRSSILEDAVCFQRCNGQWTCAGQPCGPGRRGHYPRRAPKGGGADSGLPCRATLHPWLLVRSAWRRFGAATYRWHGCPLPRSWCYRRV
ncbi:MAG: LysR family transcriptional regulator [Bradyrhizobium sp.]